MAILTKITSKLPSVSTLLTRGAGLAALGIVAYDANYLGKMEADLYSSSSLLFE